MFPATSFDQHAPLKRGEKGLLRETGLSANFRERWKYEIKIRELWKFACRDAWTLK